MIINIPLSEAEQQVLKILSRRPVTTDVIQKKLWPRRPPKHARIIVSGLLRSLEQKTKTKASKRRVIRGPRRGPYPMEAWIENR